MEPLLFLLLAKLAAAIAGGLYGYFIAKLLVRWLPW